MTSSALFSTLSGQLNNLLSQVFDNNNWNIGTNLSTGDKGWTDMEIEGILSGPLANQREFRLPGQSIGKYQLHWRL